MITKEFYYKSNENFYTIYFNNIELCLKKCQIIKIHDYLEMKTNNLDHVMKISFYGTVDINLSIEDFIKLKSLIKNILLEKNINQTEYVTSHILN
tara:strand:+ start:946 stop:1230 length:285 start_codon:yes stop_codon:yes gene_type:complete